MVFRLVTGAKRGMLTHPSFCFIFPQHTITAHNFRNSLSPPLPHTYRGKEIVVPIHPQLRNIIDAHANNGSEYLFPDAARKYIRWKGGMSVEFTALLKAHNILRPEHVITTKAGRKISVKSFHSIRHTVVTLLRSSTLFTADITRGIVGHDSEEIERQYFTMSLDSKSVGLNYIFDVIQKGGEQ